GTGSEVTSFSVVTNTETKTKYPLIADSMLPTYAVLDTNFVKSLPPKVAADTGADALCHALEAYVAKNKNPFSDALAEKAILMILTNLADAVKGDSCAKEQVHFASTMAGIAFNSAGLGLCHGMAHALGARFKIPHGRANALLLPHVIAFNAKQSETEVRYAALSRLSGNEGGQVMLVRKLVTDIRKLFAKIGIPDRLNIPLTEFTEKQTETAKAVLADACTRSNPIAPTAENIINLYKEVL
ncbi:MAG: iron-containing alcohol dehydrogenase, partial [Clostridia bacterium]|nr:iron-containing alcohol dehydrogenase [Clostridia bacterium]